MKNWPPSAVAKVDFIVAAIAAPIITAINGGFIGIGMVGHIIRIDAMNLINCLVEAVFSSEIKDVRKIGIMGAHGTGKTTLASAAASEMIRYFPRTALIQEQARACPYQVNKAMTIKSQRWLFGRQIVIEHRAAMDAEILICDRTILDPLVYATWLMEHGHNEMAPFLNIALPFALDFLRTYSALAWCRPSGFDVTDDGFRDVDPDFQYEIDTIFERFVIGYDLAVINYVKTTTHQTVNRSRMSDGRLITQAGGWEVTA